MPPISYPSILNPSSLVRTEIKLESLLNPLAFDAEQQGMRRSADSSQITPITTLSGTTLPKTWPSTFQDAKPDAIAAAAAGTTDPQPQTLTPPFPSARAVPSPSPLSPTFLVPSGQSRYEYFTTSARGPILVPVPVDTKSASKQANEKRKRNASASTRFRARRKEKESPTIERLKQKLQIMSEDCEYYKSENDRLLEALRETPGWERHLPRSPSPPSKRRSKSVQSTSTGVLDTCRRPDLGSYSPSSQRSPRWPPPRDPSMNRE